MRRGTLRIAPRCRPSIHRGGAEGMADKKVPNGPCWRQAASMASTALPRFAARAPDDAPVARKIEADRHMPARHQCVGQRQQCDRARTVSMDEQDPFRRCRFSGAGRNTVGGDDAARESQGARFRSGPCERLPFPAPPAPSRSAA